MRADRRRDVREVITTRAGGGRPLQRDVLRDVMLSADECDTWLSLEELARMTLYPPASISAQLRHLRKSRHGGFRLLKRCRVMARPQAGSIETGFPPAGPVWEYRLQRRVRRLLCGVRALRKKAGAAARAQKTKAPSRGGAPWA